MLWVNGDKWGGEENTINEVGRVRGDGVGHASHACKRSAVSHGVNCIN